MPGAHIAPDAWVGALVAHPHARAFFTQPQVLPWVEASGGAYRVNRRLSYCLGDGRVSFTNTGAGVRVIPDEPRELPLLRNFEDLDVLTALADRFVQREYAPGDVIVEE